MKPVYRASILASAMAFLAALGLPAGAADEKSGAQEAERRYALVIGNSQYRTLPKLGNPQNDAKDMCATLRKLQFDTLCFENLRTKREMKDAVVQFADKLRANKGVALFFFAGHGMQIKGENYLVPSDAELRTEADMEDEALNVNYLMAQLENTHNPFNIVILDACRNDPISRGWRSVSRGLAAIDAPTGSVIIFSTAPGKVAYDGNGRNGLFTKHLLNNIPTPGVSLEEMIKQVSRGVGEESSRAGISQTPWWNSSFTGTFCFGGCVDVNKLNDLESVRVEKARLEADIRRVQKENAERMAVQAQQEVQFKAKQAELEQQVRRLEGEASRESSKSIPVAEELATTKKQLSSLHSERLKQDEAQGRQAEELRQLAQRRRELEQKDAEIQAMSLRLAELEKEKHEKERMLEEERSRKSRAPAQPEGKRGNHEIPAVL